MGGHVISRVIRSHGNEHTEMCARETGEPGMKSMDCINVTYLSVLFHNRFKASGGWSELWYLPSRLFLRTTCGPPGV